MSFGKRPPNSQQTAVVTQPLEPELPEPRSYRGLIAIGLAGLVVVACCVVALMPAVFGTWTQKVHRLQGRLSDLSVPTIITAANADGLRFGGCVLPEPPRPYDDLFEDAERPGAGLKHDSSYIFEDQTRFFSCILESETARLCDPALRAAFARDVIKLSREIALYDDMQRAGDNNPEFERVVAELEANFDEANAADFPIASFSAQRDANKQSRTESRERLMSVFETAAQSGFVTISDFGWFAGGQFAATVKRAAGPVSSLCG
jgi:hypothetical protein